MLPDDLATHIAQKILFIPTLERRDRDQLDFNEVSVWQLRKALNMAYEAGVKAAKTSKEG